MTTDKDLPNIPAILNHVACDFCENYCKWPEKYTDESGEVHEVKLMDEHCVKCPVQLIS